MILRSINSAQKEHLSNPQGRCVETGIFKKSTVSTSPITQLGIPNDAIVDQSVHGGPDQALYLYSEEDYQWWSQKLGQALPPGIFGENLTLSEFSTQGLLIGDRLQFDDVLLEITGPRVPCFKLAKRMNDSSFIKKFVEAGKPGSYARVLREGNLSVGEKAQHIPCHQDYAAVNDVFTLWHAKTRKTSDLKQAIDSPISIHHKVKLEKWYQKQIRPE